jgi:hypothetical protein
MEIADAYATLANDGYHIAPTIIDRATSDHCASSAADLGARNVSNERSGELVSRWIACEYRTEGGACTLVGFGWWCEYVAVAINTDGRRS